MKIAVDFDDTIAQTFEDGFLGNLNNYQQAVMPGGSAYVWSLKDFVAWDAPLITGFDEETIRRLFREIDWTEVGHVPDAVTMIRNLQDDGHDVEVVTANPDKTAVRAWLNNNGLRNTMMWSIEDKVQYLLDFGYDMLIDDNPDTCIEAYEAGIDTIVFDRPWNRGVPMLRYVYWTSIYDRIKTHTFRDRVDHMNIVTQLAAPGMLKVENVVANENGALQTDLKARYDLLPARAIEEVAGVLKRGAEKYGEDNWRGLGVEECHNHTLGHAIAFNESGNIEDLAHTACRALMTLELYLHGD